MNRTEPQTPSLQPVTNDYAGHEFTRVWPVLNLEAGFKQQPEDFCVDEHIPFELSGEGEHLWCYIRKRGCNTDWLAQQLARLLAVKSVAVGYAGLKDRNAVTTQWFSIHLPGQPDPDLSSLLSDDIQILQQTRHNRKLQRGALSHNRFIIRLCDLQQLELIEQRCQLIAKHGVPNYFGEQRFGRGRNNLLQAERMFKDKRSRLPRHKRSIYLSAARSWIFNEILSRRILNQSWNRRMSGDVFMLDGKSACFRDDASADIDARLEAAEIHPTAVLWGDGEVMSAGDLHALEQTVAAESPGLSEGLIAARVEQQRRPLRLMPGNMQWQFEGNDLLLSFDLSAGSYATTVLRELVNCREPAFSPE